MKNKNFVLASIFSAVVLLIISACAPKPSSAPISTTEAAVPENTQVPEAANIGDCFNPYYPVTTGKVWNYITKTETGEDPFSIYYEDVTSSSYTQAIQTGDSLVKIAWTCSPDGLLSNQFSSLGISGVEGVEFQTVDVTGLALPSEPNWQVGFSWDTGYKLKLIITADENTLESEGEAVMTNTIAAIESVTVPAGTYPNAYRVDVTSTMNILLFGTQSEIPLNYSNWFVKDIGMVKSSFGDSPIPVEVELISIE